MRNSFNTPRLVCILLLCLLSPSFVSTLLAQEDWLPIDPEDLSLADNPDAPGSSAMILFKQETRDDERRRWDFYYRIKIFNDAGRDYADIEIPFDDEIMDLERVAARVVHTDGRVVEFEGPFFDKALAIQDGTELMAKTFTLPAVEPGVIIEYRYRLEFDEEVPLTGPWIVQERLPIREAKFELRPAIRTTFGFHVPAETFARSLPEGSRLMPGEDEWLQATLRNIPAFEPEAFMPPETSLLMRYEVLYPSLNSATEFRRAIDDYIGDANELEDAVAELVSDQDLPAVRVEKIYAAVQERIRNLSYEEAYSRRERRREGLDERDSAKEVWEFGYGTAEEITMLFVALCRAAGVPADVALVAERDSQLYDPDIELIDQVSGWAVVVHSITGGERIFDPGTRFASPNWIPWQKRGVPMLILRAPFAFRRDTVYAPPEANAVDRQLSLTLKSDGSVQGELVSTLFGDAALSQRNAFFDLSNPEREASLKNEFDDLLPTASLIDVNWNGMDDLGDSAEVSYRFEVQDFAGRIGSRLLIPSTIFPTPVAFPHQRRQHPVYFERPIHYTMETRIVVPDGYELEHQPEPLGYQIEEGVFASATTQEEKEVVHNMRLSVRAGEASVDRYPELKLFFDLVASAEDMYLILHQSQLD